MHPNTGLDVDVFDQIIYRGEGNSSIVIALKKHAKVIRLLKKDGKIMKSSQNHHVTQHPMRSMKFIHLIMKPLTEPFLSCDTELIHLKSDFINKLSDKVEAHRPVHRLDKTLLLDDQYALVMDDLCTLPLHLTKQLQPFHLCGPTISVEIKPKQGFLPMHRLVMKSTLNNQLASKFKYCCLYGSNQYLKLARGRISQKSNYCPINLFSGCPVKMRNALEELIHNPQNNLRVFKDLTLAYGDSCQVKLASILSNFIDNTESLTSNRSQVSVEKSFIELLIQCLLNDSEANTSETNRNMDDNENSFFHSDSCLRHQSKAKCKRCDIHPSSKKHKTDAANRKHQLPKSCVLSSVLKAQKLDTIGPHGALHMLNWLRENATLEAGMNVLEELSNPQMPLGFGLTHQQAYETKQQYYFRKVWEFLVSLTAKDCSIIITMRRLSPGYYESLVSSKPNIKRHLLRVPRTEDVYFFNVGIADLDQKMPLKIPRICDNLNLLLQD